MAASKGFDADVNWKTGLHQKSELERLEGSMTKFTKFLADDAGAVTIDWVALTAGILLLGIMVVYAIFNNGVSTLVSSVNSTLKKTGAGVNIGTLENQNP